MGAENLEKKYGGILPDKEDNFFPPLYNNDDHILHKEVKETPPRSTQTSNQTNNSEQKETVAEAKAEVKESIEARKRRGK